MKCSAHKYLIFYHCQVTNEVFSRRLPPTPYCDWLLYFLEKLRKRVNFSVIVGVICDCTYQSDQFISQICKVCQKWQLQHNDNCGFVSELTNSVVQQPEGPSPHSQQLTIGPYPEPVKSNPHPPQPLSLRSILIPSSHLGLFVPDTTKKIKFLNFPVPKWFHWSRVPVAC
jgi:hypothetical protein